jgi:hypothetical protein
VYEWSGALVNTSSGEFAAVVLSDGALVYTIAARWLGSGSTRSRRRSAP